MRTRARIGVIVSKEAEILAKRMGFDAIFAFIGLSEIPGLLEKALGEDIDILLVDKDAFNRYSEFIAELKRKNTFPMILSTEI